MPSFFFRRAKKKAAKRKRKKSDFHNSTLSKKGGVRGGKKRCGRRRGENGSCVGFRPSNSFLPRTASRIGLRKKKREKEKGQTQKKKKTKRRKATYRPRVPVMVSHCTGFLSTIRRPAKEGKKKGEKRGRARSESITFTSHGREGEKGGKESGERWNEMPPSRYLRQARRGGKTWGDGEDSSSGILSRFFLGSPRGGHGEGLQKRKKERGKGAGVALFQPTGKRAKK